MKLIHSIILSMLFTLAANTISAKELTEVDKSRIISESEKLIKKYVDLDIFSGVVLIAENGKPFYNHAFGLADRENNTPNKIDTKFDIGSMNKTFTQVVLYQLLGEGKLNLDDKLGKYLNGFPNEAAKNITIKMLIHHQSGYGDYHSPGYFDLPKEKMNIKSIVERIKEMPLLFTPGEDQQYSNSGYIILGAIIEKITGKTYQQNVKERIIEPLEMNDTYVENLEEIPDRAIGYFKNAKGELLNNRDLMDIPNSDGGFQSTVEDVLKFYREYFYGDKLISQKIKNQLEVFNYYDQIKETQGAIPQAGGYEGANTVIYEVLRDRISIIVFANMDEPVAEQLGAGILAIVRDQEPKEPAFPAIQNVYKSLNEKGSQFVKENFEELTKNFHPTDPKDIILNQVGYSFLFDNEIEKAIAAFKLNVELFPNVANCYDSLGEALLAKGDKEAALINYKKALELNPQMPSAQEAVKKLTAE